MRAVVEEEGACTSKLAVLLPGGLVPCPDFKILGGLTLDINKHIAGEEEGEKCKTPKRKFRDEDALDQGSSQGTINFNFNLSDNNQESSIFTPKRVKLKRKQDN